MKKLSGSLFGRYIGIDYSGAQVPESGLPGLRVYAAGSRGGPAEVRPSTGLRKHWTRRGIAEWLVRELGEGPPAVVGIDHGFSFPLKYFERHGLGLDWPAFLDDFQRHWPTDAEATRVESVRSGTVGQGALRGGDSKWRRVADVRAGGAKSVFHFDVQGSVAKSTHAGLPCCGTSASNSRGACISGRLMDGSRRRGGRSSRRFIHRCGAVGWRGEAERRTSMTPGPQRVGCSERTWRAGLAGF